MARPQIEDGHIKIARELWDAYCRFRIPGEVRQIVDSVIRQTYGWQRKEKAISVGDFSQITGMKKPHVIRSKKMAVEHKLITINGNGTLSLNKDYEQWVPFTKVVTINGNVTKSGNARPLPEMVTKITISGNKPLPKKVTIVSPPISPSPTPLSSTTPSLKENIKANIKITDSKSVQSKAASLPPVRKPRTQTANRESQVKEILQEMSDYLGYPKDESKRIITQDPIPNYGKEGNFIKKMIGRKFTGEQILQAWKYKVDFHGKEFISMAFVNEDIGKPSFWRRVNGEPQKPKPRFDPTYSHPPA